MREVGEPLKTAARTHNHGYCGTGIIHALTPKTTPHDPLIGLQPQLLIAQGVIVFCLGCDALKVVGESRETRSRHVTENEHNAEVTSHTSLRNRERPQIADIGCDQDIPLLQRVVEYIFVGQRCEADIANHCPRLDASLNQFLLNHGRDHLVEQEPHPTRRSIPARYSARPRSPSIRLSSMRSSISPAYAP